MHRRGRRVGSVGPPTQIGISSGPHLQNIVVAQILLLLLRSSCFPELARYVTRVNPAPWTGYVVSGSVSSFDGGAKGAVELRHLVGDLQGIDRLASHGEHAEPSDDPVRRSADARLREHRRLEKKLVLLPPAGGCMNEKSAIYCRISTLTWKSQVNICFSLPYTDRVVSRMGK